MRINRSIDPSEPAALPDPEGLGRIGLTSLASWFEILRG
ncbi:hypothetical protein SAMN04488142_0265 [Halomonas sp. hl-4]|nr:hypothetical protein SAMN04488142_0265 [Halomonas sp. hl-4]